MMTQSRVSLACLILIASYIVADPKRCRAEESSAGIRDGHNLLEEGSEPLAVRPGDAVGSLSFVSVQGDPVYLSEALQKGPAVLVFMSTECPLAKRYTMRLRRLHEAYADRGVRLFAIFPNRSETDESVKSYAELVEFPFPCVRDINGYLAKRLGATMTPQAFLVNQDAVLRYRGAIDDNRYENRVKQQYLAKALDAVLAGSPVETTATKAMGCSLHVAATTGEGDVTYAEHIARIMQDNCQSCHRQGQVAPFAIEDYDDAVEWQTEIQAYTHSRIMPPWKAAPGVGDFDNDVSLSEEELGLIAKWVSSGTPMGDPNDMPPPAKFNDGWAFGEPDLIVEMSEEYVIGPEGEDDYRHFIIPYEATQDKFIEAIDVRPGNRNVVHHVIGYVDKSGKARQLDAADEGPGYTRFGDVGFEVASIVGGWAPGSVPSKTPAGTGRWLPKKCDIVMQVHYYRTGVEERDRTQIGIYFSKAP